MGRKKVFFFADLNDAHTQKFLYIMGLGLKKVYTCAIRCDRKVVGGGNGGKEDTKKVVAHYQQIAPRR